MQNILDVQYQNEAKEAIRSLLRGDAPEQYMQFLSSSRFHYRAKLNKSFLVCAITDVLGNNVGPVDLPYPMRINLRVLLHYLSGSDFMRFITTFSMFQYNLMDMDMTDMIYDSLTS